MLKYYKKRKNNKKVLAAKTYCCLGKKRSIDKDYDLLGIEKGIEDYKKRLKIYNVEMMKKNDIVNRLNNINIYDIPIKNNQGTTKSDIKPTDNIINNDNERFQSENAPVFDDLPLPEWKTCENEISNYPEKSVIDVKDGQEIVKKKEVNLFRATTRLEKIRFVKSGLAELIVKTNIPAYDIEENITELVSNFEKVKDDYKKDMGFISPHNNWVPFVENNIFYNPLVDMINKNNVKINKVPIYNFNKYALDYMDDMEEQEQPLEKADFRLDDLDLIEFNTYSPPYGAFIWNALKNGAKFIGMEMIHFIYGSEEDSPYIKKLLAPKDVPVLKHLNGIPASIVESDLVKFFTDLTADRCVYNYYTAKKITPREIINIISAGYNAVENAEIKIALKLGDWLYKAVVKFSSIYTLKKIYDIDMIIVGHNETLYELRKVTEFYDFLLKLAAAGIGKVGSYDYGRLWKYMKNISFMDIYNNVDRKMDNIMEKIKDKIVDIGENYVPHAISYPIFMVYDIGHMGYLVQVEIQSYCRNYIVKVGKNLLVTALHYIMLEFVNIYELLFFIN